MSEIRTLNPVDTYIYPSATIIAALRAAPRELQNALGWMLEHEANSGGGVLGGFAVTEGAALRSDVARGAALVYDSGAASPLSKWAWAYSEATLQATHDAHNGSNPRIDLLTLSWASATDTEQTLGRTGGVPGPVDTQRGCVATLNITKGTAAATPVAPAVPSGHLLLYHVWVPTSSGALVYYDKRTYAAGPRNRPATKPHRWNARVTSDPDYLGDAVVTMDSILGRAGADGEEGFESESRWDMVQDYPHFYRDRDDAAHGTATGEQPGYYYPMACYGDRKWWQTFAVINGQTLFTAGDSGDINYTLDATAVAASLKHVAGTDACTVTLLVPLSVQGRKLEIVEAKLDYKYTAVFTGAVVSVLATLWVQEPGETSIAVATFDVHAAGAGSWTNATMTPVATAIGDDFRMWLGLTVNRSGAGITDAGEVAVASVSVRFKEGRG